MPLVDATTIATYLDVSGALAARIAALGLVKAETYLRLLKGDLWYDQRLTEGPPDPAGSGTAPAVLVYAPHAGLVVGTELALRARIEDGDGLTKVSYQVDYDLYAEVPLTGTPAAVDLDLTLALPDDGAAHDVRLTAFCAGGDRTGAVWSPVEVGEALPAPLEEVTGTGGGVTEEAAPHATPKARTCAEEAEATLALYYALPQLNLKIDEAGGIQEVTYFDDGQGTKQQIRFANSESIAALRRELLSQAKLLVQGDVREEIDHESNLLTAVGDLGPLSGWGVTAI